MLRPRFRPAELDDPDRPPRGEWRFLRFMYGPDPDPDPLVPGQWFHMGGDDDEPFADPDWTGDDLPPDTGGPFWDLNRFWR